MFVTHHFFHNRRHILTSTTSSGGVTLLQAPRETDFGSTAPNDRWRRQGQRTVANALPNIEYDFRYYTPSEPYNATQSQRLSHIAPCEPIEAAKQRQADGGRQPHAQIESQP